MNVALSLFKDTICILKVSLLDDLLYFATDRVHSTVGSLVSEYDQPGAVEVDSITVRLLRMGVFLDVDEPESAGGGSGNFYETVRRVLTNLTRPYVDIGLSFYFLLARRTKMGYRVWSPNVVTGGLRSLMIINPPGSLKLVDIVYLRLNSHHRRGKWYITELMGSVYVERLLEVTDLANHIEPLVFRREIPWQRVIPSLTEEFSSALSPAVSVERLLEVTKRVVPVAVSSALSPVTSQVLSPALSSIVLTVLSPVLSPVLPPLPDGATWKECEQFIRHHDLPITTRGRGRNREAILADIRRLCLSNPSSPPRGPGNPDRFDLHRVHDEIGRSGLTPSSKRTAIHNAGTPQQNGQRRPRSEMGSTGETPASKRAAHLERERVRKQLTRAIESAESRSDRLERNRAGNESARAGESAESRSGRLQSDRAGHQSSRVGESAESRSVRLERNRAGNESARAGESAESRSGRLESDRTRHQSARAGERGLRPSNDDVDLIPRTLDFDDGISAGEVDPGDLESQSGVPASQSGVQSVDVPISPFRDLRRQPNTVSNMSKYRKELNSHYLLYCTICQEAWFFAPSPRCPPHAIVEGQPHRVGICARCKLERVQLGLVHKFSSANDAHPRAAPSFLPTLTFLGEMMIAQHLVIMRIYRLKSGAHGYTGSCLSVPQNVCGFVKSIPRRLDRDQHLKKSFVIVRQKVPTTVRPDGYRDFRVPRDHLWSWIQFLLHNSKWYKYITLDKEALALIPETPEEISQSFMVDSAPEQVEPGQEQEYDDDASDASDDRRDRGADYSGATGGNEPVSESCLPDTSRAQSEEDKLALAVTSVVDWPEAGVTPVSEFNNPGLFAKAFPCVHPFGDGDPTDETHRVVHISFKDMLCHLTKYAVVDDTGKLVYPITRHPRWAFYAFNMKDRHTLMDQTNVCLKQHPDVSVMTMGELQAKVLEPDFRRKMVNIFTSYVANVPGTEGYWFAKRQELEAIAARRGMGFWFTFSYGENFLADLHRLLPGSGIDAEQKKKYSAVTEHPHLVDAWFGIRLELFMKYFFVGVLGAVWWWFRFEYQARKTVHGHGCGKLKDDPGVTELARVVFRGRDSARHLWVANQGDRQWLVEQGQQNEWRTDQFVRDSEEVHMDYATYGMSDTKRAELRQNVLDGKKADAVILAYVNGLVTTWNLDPPHDAKSMERDHATVFTHSADRPHPLSVPVPEANDFDGCKADYSQRANATMRHMCTPGYCEKNGSCRFKYPHVLMAVTKLLFTEQKAEERGGPTTCGVKLFTARNDQWLNTHNEVQFQDFGGCNCDFQLIFDVGGHVRYITKYASKGEKASDALERLFTSRVASAQADDPVSTLLRSVVIRSQGERDVGSQEIARRSMGLPLCRSSLPVHRISVGAVLERKVRKKSTTVDESGDAPADDVPAARKHIEDLYADRLSPSVWASGTSKPSEDVLEVMFYYLFLEKYTVTNNDEIKLYVGDRVILITPHRNSNPKGKNYAEYCKFQLLLYVPWQGGRHMVWDCEPLEEPTDEHVITKWRNYCLRLGQDCPAHLQEEVDRIRALPVDPDVSQDEGLCSGPPASLTQGRGDEDAYLDVDVGRTSLSQPDLPTDIRWNTDHDWAAEALPEFRNLSNDSKQELASGLARAMNDPLHADRVRHRRTITRGSLNAEQCLAHDIAVRAISDLHGSPLLMLLLGRAGGGKSYVVDAIMSSLSEAVTRVKLMATTGKAGFIIGGSTVHSWKLGLALPTGKMAQIPLKNPYLIAFQERLQFTNTLILDEFSMLSLMMLYWMDQRCRQAKPHNAHLPFGGMNVILIGDIGQLPPVIPYCLWSGLSGKKFKEKQASMIYHLFDTVVILQVNNRQAEPVFRGILDRLYDGETTKEDWVLLQSRSRSAIPNWETTFGAKDTVHLHVRNKDVLEQNLRTLQSLNKPIARFNADHASAADKGVEGDKAMDLQPFLYLCKGAQVLHTTNTCQPWGLCNGAVGTVVDFIMGEEGPPALPLAVIVDFGEYYIGPPLFGPDEPASAENPNPVSKKGWVSIEPITAEWSDNAKAHSRTMLPLKLSWAWTVWKAQGQTLTGRLVLHLGDTEKTAGIAYTAMSRATRLENIAHYGITLERLTTMITRGSGFVGRRREEDRLRAMAISTADRLGPVFLSAAQMVELRGRLQQPRPPPPPDVLGAAAGRGRGGRAPQGPARGGTRGRGAVRGSAGRGGRGGTARNGAGRGRGGTAGGTTRATRGGRGRDRGVEGRPVQ